MDKTIIQMIKTFLLFVIIVSLAHTSFAKEINFKKVNSIKLETTKIKPVQIVKIRWSVISRVSSMKKIRIVCDLSGTYSSCVNIIGKINELNNVLEVHLNNSVLSPKIYSKIILNSQIVTSFRFIENKKDLIMRILLTKKIQKNDYTFFILKEDQLLKKPCRLVVDITKLIPQTKLMFNSRLEGKSICIDPGHGGSDCGAIGIDKTFEKDITLPICLELKNILEQQGINVIMTREIDKDVFSLNSVGIDELQSRVNIANNNKTDLFICVHANSYIDTNVHGVSTFYYPKTNLDSILAGYVQKEFINIPQLSDRGINRANFYVLRYSKMPAILLETGFISNKNDCKQLITKNFQKIIALSIMKGVVKFFYDISDTIKS